MRYAYALAAPIALACTPALGAEYIKGEFSGVDSNTGQTIDGRVTFLVTGYEGGEILEDDALTLRFVRGAINVGDLTFTPVDWGSGIYNLYVEYFAFGVNNGESSFSLRTRYFPGFSEVLRPAAASFSSSGTLVEFNQSELRGSFTFTSVPEPGTWALMILGFGAIGYAIRSQRKASVRYA